MAKKRAEEHDGLEALFAAAPSAFVAERTRIVAALKGAGRVAEARAVAAMKRPTASVWAVNQLVQRAPQELAALLDLGASLRLDERRLQRGGSADDFMSEARAARQKVAALARRAEALLPEAGHKATLALSRQIAQTLQAAALGTDETRAALLAGRLTTDLTPPTGFVAPEPSASSSGGAPAKPHKRKSAPNGAVVELRDLRRAQAAERKHSATRRRAVAAAERLVSERARAVDHARASVERAEQELRQAKDALVEAESAAAVARRAATEP